MVVKVYSPLIFSLNKQVIEVWYYDQMRSWIRFHLKKGIDKS